MNALPALSRNAGQTRVSLPVTAADFGADDLKIAVERELAYSEALSHLFPGGVKHQRRNMTQGIPTNPKIINVPIYLSSCLLFVNTNPAISNTVATEPLIA